MIEPTLFVSGDCPVMPAHVLAASAFWSELDGLHAEVARRTARAKQWQAQGREVDSSDLQAASELFRKARGLRTAQSTQAWMSAWGLTVDAFTEFLEREAMARVSDGIDGDAPEAAAEAEDAQETLWPEAVFRGLAEVWCQRLAGRMAVAREKAGTHDLPASLFDPAAAPGLAPGALRRWLDRLRLPSEWFDRLVGLESVYARYAETVQTPARMEAALRARWTSLFLLSFEIGTFATEAAAREAGLCVTEDGLAIDRVCQEACGEYGAGQAMLGDFPESVRGRALSATPGTLLPVFAWNGRYALCRIRGKSEPSLSHADTRAVVGRALMEEAVRPLIQRHISWSPGIA